MDPNEWASDVAETHPADDVTDKQELLISGAGTSDMSFQRAGKNSEGCLNPCYCFLCDEF